MTQSRTVHSKIPLGGLIYIGLLPSSLIGPLWVASSEIGLVALEWSMPEVEFINQVGRRFLAHVIHDQARTGEPLNQLAEYLAGRRLQFELPLDLSHLTDFQRRVLQLTAAIPYGQTSTYKEIAFCAGSTHAARAVGRVEATNPIPLIIPCHRVIGTDGSLHGYGGPGGVKLKAWLLDLEGAQHK